MDRRPLPMHDLVVRVRRRDGRVLLLAPVMTLLSRVPAPVRRFLDHDTTWRVVFATAIIATVGGLYFVNGRTSRTLASQAAVAAAATAERQAGIQADYRACLVSIPQLTKVNRFVHGVQALHLTLLTNALATHAATAPGSALYRQQIVNIARLRRTVTAVSGVAFPVPTKASCEKRRRQATGHP